MIPLAWANIPIFDYQGCMQLGPMPLYFWGVSNDDALKDDALNPIGKTPIVKSWNFHNKALLSVVLIYKWWCVCRHGRGKPSKRAMRLC